MRGHFLKYADNPQSLRFSFCFWSDKHLELLFFVCHLNQPFLQQTLHSFHVLFLLPHTAQECGSVSIHSFMEFNSTSIYIYILFYCVHGPQNTSQLIFYFLSWSCTPFLILVERQLGGSLHGYNQKQMEGERGQQRERERERRVFQTEGKCDARSP